MSEFDLLKKVSLEDVYKKVSKVEADDDLRAFDLSEIGIKKNQFGLSFNHPYGKQVDQVYLIRDEGDILQEQQVSNPESNLLTLLFAYNIKQNANGAIKPDVFFKTHRGVASEIVDKDVVDVIWEISQKLVT